MWTILLTVQFFIHIIMYFLCVEFMRVSQYKYVHYLFDYVWVVSKVHRCVDFVSSPFILQLLSFSHK